MGVVRDVPQSVKNVNKFARLRHNSHDSFFSDRTSFPANLNVADWVLCDLASLNFPKRALLQGVAISVPQSAHSFQAELKWPDSTTETQTFPPVLAALNSSDPCWVFEIPADRKFQAGLKILLRFPSEFFSDL